MEMALQQRGSSSSRPGSATQPTAMKKEQEEEELRRGPWTVDEDLTLVNYIAEHGDGRWNALARAAGLKRTGKSCRLRWLNYLRPDVKRGDFTADEQLLILDLHSRWGNRWSKIAQQLPGRTDNEIKNYWRTRVQKHARQLNCDVNSRRFKEAMIYLAQRAAAASQCNSQSQQHPVFLAGGDSSNVANKSSASSCDLSAVLTTAATPPPAACSSSSDSSLTSTESAHEEKSVLHLPNSGGCWPTMQSANHEFWELQELNVDMPDLTGWVQGFSEGIPDADHSLWSLEDIWRMQ